MSFFKAVNFEALNDVASSKNEDEQLDQINITTTELQIESGFEIFDEAMKLYDSGVYFDSIDKFNELLGMDLFRMDHETTNTLEDIKDYLPIYVKNVDENISVDSVSDNSSYDDDENFNTEIEEVYEKVVQDLCDFNFSYRSEKLDNLRYLAFRNFSMVLHKYLVTELDKDPETKQFDWKNFVYLMKTLLFTALKCLCFQDVISPDIKLVELIVNCLISFKSKKLTRNVLEIILVDNKHLINSKVLLPSWKRLISTELMTLEAVFENPMDVSNALKSLIIKNGDINKSHETRLSCKTFEYLEKYINLQLEILKDSKNEMKEEIEVDFYRWNTLVTKLFNLVPADSYTYNFKKENPDPYNLLGFDETISRVVFKIKDENNMDTFNLQQNQTFLGNQQVSFKKFDDDFEKEESIISSKPFEPACFFVSKVEMKRKASLDLQDEEDSSMINKKRVSRRVRNLAEDQQKDVKLLDIQPKYLSNFEKLVNAVNNLKIDEDLNFLTLKDVETFEFVKKYGELQYCMSDLFDCFAKWDKQLSEQFIGAKSKQTDHTSFNLSNDIVEQILEKLFYSLHEISIEDAPKLYNEGYYSFLKKINKGKKVHYQQVRIELLKTLLVDNYNNNSLCLITDFLWPTKMAYIIEFLVMCFQDHLLQTLDPSNHLDFLFAVSIYEVLVDSFLKNLKELNRLKHKSGDLFDNVQTLKEKIEAWNFNFFHSFSVLKLDQLSSKTVIRLKWSNMFYEKTMGVGDDNDLTEEFNSIKFHFYSQQEFIIGNYNYLEIPPVNSSTLQLMTMKDSLISNNESNSLNQVLQVLLNANIFVENNTNSSSWEVILAKFVNSIKDPSVKREIWTTVFKSIAIEDEIEFELIDKCFLKILCEFKDLLSSSNYLDNSAVERRVILLKILSDLYDILESYSQFLLKEAGNFNENILFKINRTNKEFNIILELYVLVYSVVNYETIISNEFTKDSSFFGKAKLSAKKWKALLAYFSTVVSFSYDRVISVNLPDMRDSLITDFIKNQHLLLSEFNCCDYAEKNFLLYSQRTLFGIAEADQCHLLQQTLYCNYGFSLSGDVEKHLTEKNESIDAIDSYMLCNHIMKGYLHSDNTMMLRLFEPPYLKNEIESTVAFISGNQYLTAPSVQGNRKHMDTYLSQDLKYDLIIDNAVSLSIMGTGTNYEIVVKTKILLAAAINFLSIYYTRKHKGLDQTSLITGLHGSTFNTVDNMIELLKTNIIFNCSTYETWYFLGECYTILAEYDLNLTAEKLNSHSKKEIIGGNQRKAILCFFMALKLFSNENDLDNCYYYEILYMLYAKLGTSLFHATTLPMDGLAFVFGEKENEILPDSLYDLSAKDKTVKLKNLILYFFAEKYMALGLNIVHKITNFTLNNDPKLFWMLPYYITYSMKQLNKPIDEYMKNVFYLCKVSLSQQENVTFALTNLIQHLYFSIDYFKKHSTIKSEEETNKHVLKCLEILLNYKDHFKNINQAAWKLSSTRPVNELIFKKILVSFCTGLINDPDGYIGSDYPERLIKCIISKDLGDFKAILSCLKPILSIASPVKPLIVIQNADLEQPGYLFVCNTVFANLLLETLVELKEFSWLPFVFKKLKRASNRILGTINIYDRYLSIYTDHIKVKYNGLDIYEDMDMAQLNYVIDLMLSEPIEFEYFNKPSFDVSPVESIKNESNEQSIIYKYNSETRLIDTLSIFEQRSENAELYEKVSLFMFTRLLIMPYVDSLKAFDKWPSDDTLINVKSKGSQAFNSGHMINKMQNIFKKLEGMGKLFKPPI
ncbi:hypothetical protein QEN19_002606 [Hanseniaspora menglaensis]